MSRDLGWDYFEKLARQQRHAGAVGRRSAEEARARRARDHGRRQRLRLILVKESGGPVEIVYPTEGTPLIVGPNASSRRRPIRTRRGCSRCYCFTPNASSCASTSAACVRCIRDVKEKPGRTPLRDIKVMKDDAAAVEKNAEEIKAALHQDIPGMNKALAVPAPRHAARKPPVAACNVSWTARCCAHDAQVHRFPDAGNPVDLR